MTFALRCARISLHMFVFLPPSGRARIHSVGFSCRPLPDAAPRGQDERAEEGPRLTAPSHDSLRMLCRVTSANHNNPLHPPHRENVIQRTGPWPFYFFFFCSNNEATGQASSQGGDGGERLLEVQLCFIQLN